MEKDLNAVHNSSEAQKEAEASKGVVDPQESSGEAPPEAEIIPGRQGRAANARFAELRRERDRLEKELEAARGQLSEREGGDEADAPDASQGELERLRKEAGELRLLLYKGCFERDLSEIKALWPDERAETVGELGGMFAALRAFGIDNVTAYAAVRESEKAKTPAPPPETGAISGASEAYREYFSSREADRLTPAQLDNPRIMEKVMRSMKKWK